VAGWRAGFPNSRITSEVMDRRRPHGTRADRIPSAALGADARGQKKQHRGRTRNYNIIGPELERPGVPIAASSGRYRPHSPNRIPRRKEQKRGNPHLRLASSSGMQAQVVGRLCGPRLVGFLIGSVGARVADRLSGQNVAKPCWAEGAPPGAAREKKIAIRPGFGRQTEMRISSASCYQKGTPRCARARPPPPPC